MKISLLIITLFACLSLAGQDLRKLEDDLASTAISDLRKIEKKAEQIFEFDPFNETATYYLTESYRNAGKASLIQKFFEEKISSAPKNPKPYLLSAIYRHRNFSHTDTARLQDLKTALALDPNNFEANYLLGISYYQLFNEKVSSAPTFLALQSRKYLIKSIEIDSITFSYLKYPVIQLSFFLNDTEIANQFENLELRPFVNETQIPKKGQFHFPVDKFIQLDDGWKSSYKIDILRDVNLSIFILRWYSGHLSALNEPLLFGQSKDTVYRFTWLRTFHHPVAIRIRKVGNEILLTWKMTDGAGGYAPGQLIVDESKKLMNAEWEEFQALLVKANYWDLSTLEESNVMGMDGSQWIIEGVQNGKYNVVDRWTPRNSAFQEIGSYLISLTDLEIPKRDVY